MRRGGRSRWRWGAARTMTRAGSSGSLGARHARFRVIARRHARFRVIASGASNLPVEAVLPDEPDSSQRCLAPLDMTRGGLGMRRGGRSCWRWGRARFQSKMSRSARHDTRRSRYDKRRSFVLAMGCGTHYDQGRPLRVIARRHARFRVIASGASNLGVCQHSPTNTVIISRHLGQS
jgi:hypothetical protein